MEWKNLYNNFSKYRENVSDGRSTRGQSKSDGERISGDNRGVKFSKKTERGIKNEYTDDFRRIQKESKGLSTELKQSFHNSNRHLDERVRKRLSRIFREQLQAKRGKLWYDYTSIVNETL